jgi:hypothetical protein
LLFFLITVVHFRRSTTSSRTRTEGKRREGKIGKRRKRKISSTGFNYDFSPGKEEPADSNVHQ